MIWGLNCYLYVKEKRLKAPVQYIYDHEDDIELHCVASALGFVAASWK